MTKGQRAMAERFGEPVKYKNYTGTVSKQYVSWERSVGSR